MDDAANVCSHLSAACHILHQTGNDNEEECRQQLQDPTSYTTKCYYNFYNPPDAILWCVADPIYSTDYSRQKGYQCDSKNGYRDGTVHNSHGHCCIGWNKKTRNQQQNGSSWSKIGNRSSIKHILVAASVHSAWHLWHLHCCWDARVFL